MIGLGWLAYVRADYRDSANNESHFLSRIVSPAFIASTYYCRFSSIEAIQAVTQSQNTLTEISSQEYEEDFL